MWRIQVKTSNATLKKRGRFSAQFRSLQSAIDNPSTPELHFVFAVRKADVWLFVVIARAVLANYVRASTVGSPATVKAKVYRSFYFSFDGQGKVDCSGVDITHHLSDWSTWPTIPQ